MSLEVIPVGSPGTAERFFLVLFQDFRPVSGPQSYQVLNHDEEPSKPEVQASEKEDEILSLRQELAATKEYLQSVIESQEAFNEELCSANEELTTLNEELQTRNLELAKINDDLSNLLNSINIAIVMLDNDLRVRRFTPCAEKLFSLIPTDLGRPFGDINPKLSVPNLTPIIREVVDTLGSQEVEVQDSQGHWYNLKVRPYKTLDHKIDGAVLALMDIDTLKRSEEDLDATRQALEYAEAIIGTVREPLLVLTRDLRVKTANQSFYQTFQVSPEETQDHSIYTLGNGQWDIPQLCEALQKTVFQGIPLDNLILKQRFPRLGRRQLTLNARPLALKGDAQGLILLGIEDKPECSDSPSSG